jgi:hypothetical protein
MIGQTACSGRHFGATDSDFLLKAVSHVRDFASIKKGKYES